MSSIFVRNEGEMEAGIDYMMQLIKSKKKKKELNVYTTTRKLAELFIENAHREIEILNIKTSEPELSLNIFVDGDNNNGKKKGKPKR